MFVCARLPGQGTSPYRCLSVRTCNGKQNEPLCFQTKSNDLGGITNKRTTADSGGPENVPQLEFEHSISEKLEGVFADVHAILSLMADQNEVLSVKYHAGELNDHFRFRSICTLKNGITPRQYFVGIINLKDGQEAMLVEIQRENLALTTLMILSNTTQKWNLICHKIIKELIKKSGSWPNIEEFKFEGLEVCKFKHTNIGVNQRAKRMIDKLIV